MCKHLHPLSFPLGCCQNQNLVMRVIIHCNLMSAAFLNVFFIGFDGKIVLTAVKRDSKSEISKCPVASRLN